MQTDRVDKLAAGRPRATVSRGVTSKKVPAGNRKRRCSMSISLRDQLRRARKEGLLPALRSKPKPKHQEAVRFVVGPRLNTQSTSSSKRRPEGPASAENPRSRSRTSEPANRRSARAAAWREHRNRDRMDDRIPQRPQHAASVATEGPRREPPKEPAKPVIRSVQEIAARRAEQATHGSSGLLKPVRGGERVPLRDYVAPPVHIIYTPSGGKPDR